MNAGLGFESAVEAISEASPQSFSASAMNRLEGRPVVRLPLQLRLHRALGELGWTGVIDEFNDAVRLTHLSVTEPILITTNGTILAGFGRWRSAILTGRLEINCIEYQLNEDESLHFILTHHQSRNGWNDFVRIRLALTMEPNLRQKALDNMRAGGKLKGLANLPEAQHIDVRKEIARIAGVGDRNVGNVETILERAHPRLIVALQNGTLRISRALQFCKLSRAEQLEQFIRHSEERETNKVIRRAIRRPEKIEDSFDVISVLDALQHRQAQQPGSVAVRIGRHKRTVILVGKDLMTTLPSQKELHLT
jgi:hypothetical protein